MPDIRRTETVLKALANRRRLGILKYLRKVGHATVRGIAQEIGLSFKATSKHLVLLTKSYLIERDQIGLDADYSLSPIHSITKSSLDSF